MPIVTSFAFDHRISTTSTAMTQPKLSTDPLGLLRNFVGDVRLKKWKGQGFNLIWRPNFGPPRDFFLQLMFTEETLDFTDISGSGIANRGFKQADIFLGGAAYVQHIRDSFDGSDQHFEPGVWINVPQTTNPAESASVARMGSIPHGTTINLQGRAELLTDLDMSKRIPVSSIKPFSIGSKDDGTTGVIEGAFDAEQDLGAQSASRTDLARVAALSQAQLTNPNAILQQANQGLVFDKIIEIPVSSNSAEAGSVPDVGGGIDNIAFLGGKTAAGGANPENADVPIVTATFWIQTAKDAQGNAVAQLQYTQRVLLNFNTLSWPHVTVGTLRPEVLVAALR